MMRFTRLVCGYMSTFLLEMLYTIHACRTRVSSPRARVARLPGCPRARVPREVPRARAPRGERETESVSETHGRRGARHARLESLSRVSRRAFLLPPPFLSLKTHTQREERYKPPISDGVRMDLERARPRTHRQ
jgi:hypothetical protein